jgi:hypothetical protein
MKKQIKIIMVPIAVFIASLFIGFTAGRTLGNRFVENIVLRQARFPLLLSRPVSQFYDIYTLINSNNPYSRLSGYYSLIDNKMINDKFLMERFRREQNDALRGSILWILGNSSDRGGVLRFCASVYEESSDTIKKRILGLMKRVDNDYYLLFIRNNRIDAGFINGEGHEVNYDMRF